MKKLLFLLLCSAQLAAYSQSVQDIVFKPDLQKVAQDVASQKARIDSIVKVLGKGDGGTQNPPNGLKPCVRGPVPGEVYNVTTTGAMVLWDGEDVQGWDYSIYKGSSRVAFGSVVPKGNREPITYAGLEPGEYTISMQGNTCKSDVRSISFTIPKPSSGNGGGDTGNNGPPPVTDKAAKFQLILGTTGSGFDAKAKYGISEGEWINGVYHEGWVDRIEAFKYSWGYGITGICVWVPWDSYEKTPGVYEEAAFKRIISFCRARDLTLSVAFLGRRHRGDGFIREDEIITGSNGTQYAEGVPETAAIYAGYGNDRVNALMVGAIQSIAKLLKTYEKSFYMAMAGGGAGEQVNHVFQNNGIWEVSDFSQDNLRRFNQWAANRGIANAGRPPIIAGPGIDWPHPDYNNPVGLEFGRYTTYGLYKYYKNFVDAVKGVSELPCIYYYSVSSNRQFRAIQNPNMNFIAGAGDGMYGSDGDGLDDLKAKVKVNSLNLGTFPSGISATEVDADDISPARMLYGRMPQYCEGNLNYDAFYKLANDLYGRGLQALHFAMAYCTQEIKGFEPVLKPLHQKYIGKAYIRPVINASNTVTVEVTEKYRRSEDLMEGIDPYTQYTRYTDCNFWGPVKPAGATSCETSDVRVDQNKLTGYLDANLGAYGGNVRFDVKSSTGPVYSYERGSVGADSRIEWMSHSKFTTGATLAVLIAEGKLNLETKAGDLIPSWNKPGLRDITLRQIIGHTSGIPDDQTNEGAQTLEQYVDWLAGRPGFKTPGSEYQYSTVSYQVAARMAEIVTGQSWKDIFNTRIRDKVGMGNAEYNPRGAGPIYGNPLNPHAGYGLQATPSEWANFAAMIRDGGIFNGVQVLSSKALDILKTRMSRLSNWGFGVILNGLQLISEAANGCYTFILPGYYSATLATKSTYDSTIGVNNGLRAFF